MKIEFKSFIVNKKNIIICLLITLVLIISNINISAKHSYRVNVDILNSNIVDLKERLSSSSLDKGVEDTLKKQLKLTTEEKESFIKKDYKTYWEKKIELNSDVDIPNDIINEDIDFFQRLISQRDYFDYLKKHHLDFPMNEITYEGAFETVSLTFITFTTDVILALFVILIGDFFARKFEDEKIRYYRLIRQNKWRTILNHLIVPFTITLSFVMLIFSINYLANGIATGKWGNPIFPYGQFNLATTPYWELDLIALIFLILTLLFIITLTQLLTVIFKKTLVVVGTELLLIVGYNFLNQKDFFKPFIKFFPFEYLFGLSVIFTDEKYLFADNSLLIGGVYLLGCSIVFYILTNILYQKWIYRTK